MVVDDCCYEFADRSELECEFAVLGVDREAEAKAGPRRQDREVLRRSRHPLGSELVSGERVPPALNPCQEYGRGILLGCESVRGRDRRRVL